MKKLIGTIALTSLLATTVLLPVGCAQETEKTEITPSESNRWLELLRVLPENENTVKAAYLSDWSYAAEKMSDGKYAVGRGIPLFQYIIPIGPGNIELKENLGFSGDEITSVIYAGALPVNYYQAVRGDFNREDVDNAAKTGPMNEMLELEVITYKGHDFYSWGEDFEINLAMRSNIRPLGRGHRLALVDDFIFWVLWTDGIKEMIDSYEGNIPSLADNEDYWLLAGALEELDTVTAFFSSEPQSASNFKEIHGQQLEEMEPETREVLLGQLESGVKLKPYLALAAGAGKDDKGYYLAIALVNIDATTAKDNAQILKQKPIDAMMVWPPEGVRYWFSLTDSVTVQSRGRVTMAKFYGPIVEYWDRFDMSSPWGPYEPLLLHE